ncbi:GNAT family N-acetyltransferase [Bacillus solimangrovi]|uniref:GNAT family N-acetyltransferase n=1 Tax=Bacillus solimangrovi TaxID=1305675 RepID=A0A1E5LCA8_9BACI|nr:GNAT family N-acetyltransferase [Bacillus solimangrovi]OEH91707.1 GNAT family N-acetyltransferase [Bacillus solimangrovi]
MNNIREALFEDAYALSDIALRSKAHWDYSEDFIEACREDLTITGQYIRQNDVYILDGVEGIIGFFTFERGESNSLDFFYINPDFIGKGFGKTLWEYMIKKAQELDINSFTIDSDPNAKGFYERMGAKQIGETPSTVFKGRMLPLMKYTVQA